MISFRYSRERARQNFAKKKLILLQDAERAYAEHAYADPAYAEPAYEEAETVYADPSSPDKVLPVDKHTKHLRDFKVI